VTVVAVAAVQGEWNGIALDAEVETADAAVGWVVTAASEPALIEQLFPSTAGNV